MKIDEGIMRGDERAVLTLRSLYLRYGYTPFKMNRFEEYEFYVRNKDFLVSDEVITFTDPGGRLLALKPDVTLSIIKNTRDGGGAVQKLFYNENVYRVEPGAHSFKEILQAGLECVGDIGAYEICEVALLAAKSLALIGGDYVLDLSHMGLVSAVLDGCGLSDKGRARALGCLARKSVHELERLCREEALAERAAGKLLALAGCCGAVDAALAELEGRLDAEPEREALRAFAQVCRVLESNGFGAHIRVDFSVGNDMKYYSGVVFKGYLAGIPTGVLSGGQYDRLLRKMGRSSGAIGFAVYLNLLERREEPESDYDVDVLLLHGPDDDPAQLVAATEKLAAMGSVLVASAPPALLRCRMRMRFEEGRAVLLENDA